MTGSHSVMAASEAPRAPISLKHWLARSLDRQSPRLYYELLLATRSRHIEPELWFARRFCRRDRAAIDVGANEGLFSLFLAKHARRVYALEPNPDCAARLRSLLPRRVELLSLAASDTTGRAELRFDPSNTGIGTIEAANRLDNNPGIHSLDSTSVATATLDSLVAEPVSFIKIDVEGHEEAVLRGAEEVLRRWRPSVLVEVEERHNPGAVGRVAASMAARGYRGFFLMSGSWRPIEDLDPSLQDPSRLYEGGIYVNNFLYVSEAEASKLPVQEPR